MEQTQEITAKEDICLGIRGERRRQFYFPTQGKTAYERATQPGITGGLYIPQDMPIPDTIVIRLKKEE